MEFKDFPMLSADVLALSTDESVDALQDGQAIFLQRYQDDWLAVQGMYASASAVPRPMPKYLAFWPCVIRPAGC